jgi:general secretion pathway protein D
MRYQKRVYLFYLLFSLVLYYLPVGHAEGARLSGDNKVTPAAPDANSEVTVPPAINPAPGEMTDSTVAVPAQEENIAIEDNVSKKSAAENTGNSSIKNTAKEEGGSVKGNRQQEYVTIDFDNVDIALFIKFISELTGKNFVIDSNVKGKITIISPTKITIEEAYKVFESVLEVNGFATVPSGSIIKIVPMAEARSKDIDTKLREEPIDPDDRIVTRLIPLKYANPEEIKSVLGPLISKNSIIVSYAPTGMLIITDVLSNIKRLLEIIDVIDVEGTGEVISVIPLEHAGAQSMAKSLTSVFKTTTAKGAKGESTSIIIVADDRTNSLLTLASEIDTLRIKELIKLLDKEAPKGEGDIHIYYLQNANAEDLAKVLTAIPKNKTTTSAASTTAPSETAAVLSKEVQILADKATNSLIINASKDDYLVLEDIIKKLDIPRRMVYIEALIMEVSMNKQFELGVQWLGGKPAGELRGNDIGVFSGSNPGTSNLPSVDTTGLVSLPTGFSLGVLGDTITIGDLTFPSIAAVVRAYGTNSDVHILSTPQIMTMDNEEAEIKVAENVPFITRKDTSTTGVDYSNYEFKDVGVILNITPQINQERFVRLKISQEVSQIVSLDAKTGQPTTLKREAKTTVVIKDGQTVVIGGLIDEIGNKTNYKVPLLGDIPILGNLFRSRTESLDKKNLYIFLTPHIIENPEEAREVYENKKSQIETVQEGVINMNRGRSAQTKDERLSDLGYGYIQIKDYDKAAEYYEKALKINPDNPFALLNMGFIYEKKKDIQKAIEMYERLISLDPDDRAYVSTEPAQTGRKLTDIARDNLKNLKESNE